MTKATAIDVRTDREVLAKRVIFALTHTFAKIAEYKHDIRRLWHEFDNLKPGETIADCKTKTEFCLKRLHRSMRAVQYLLHGREQSSHRPKQRLPKRDKPKVALSATHINRLLKTAAITGELIKASEHNNDLLPIIRELKQIAFDFATLDSILEPNEEHKRLYRWPYLQEAIALITAKLQRKALWNGLWISCSELRAAFDEVLHEENPCRPSIHGFGKYKPATVTRMEQQEEPHGDNEQTA